MKECKKYHLSAHRRRKALQITDIAFLLGITPSKLSRFENGKSLPPELKVILGYHILFDLPIPTIIHEEYERLRESIESKCFQLLEKIENIKSDYNSESRKAAINDILQKIIPQECEG